MSDDISSQILEPSPAAAPIVPTKQLPWGPTAAIIVTALAFVIAQVVAGVVIGLWPNVAHWSSARSNGWLDSVAGQFFFVLLAEALTVGIVWWFLRQRKASAKLLGYERRPRWIDLAYAASAFGVYFVLLIAAESIATSFFHINDGQKQDLGFNSVVGLPQQLMTFVSLVILPPLVEETLFRGFLYGGLRKRFNVVTAALVTSALFALPHLFESTSLLWVAGIDTFVLSLVLCYVREKTGNLYAGIIIHMAKNGLAFLALYVFVIH